MSEYSDRLNFIEPFRSSIAVEKFTRHMNKNMSRLADDWLMIRL